MNKLTGGTGKVGALALSRGVLLMTGSGAPTDGTTGAGKAAPGSLYFDATNGAAYLNTGTKASPAWKAVTHA